MKRWIFLFILFMFGSSFAHAQTERGHRFIANQGNQLFVFDQHGNVESQMKLKSSPHDIHRLENGNFLTHQGTEVVEIDIKQNKVVWNFDVRKLGTAKKIELHSVAPLANQRLMVALSGEAKILEIDRTGKVLHSIEMKIDNPHPHRDTRLVRPLKDGNYLVAHEGDGAVREYDRDGKAVWEYQVPLFKKKRAGGHGPEAFGNAVFSAIRLSNGNTMIGTGNGHSVLEVSPKKEIVWKLQQNDLKGITLAWVTTLEMHPDGSLVIGNCHAGKSNPQLIKIDRKKNVLWSFQNFKQLGNSVSNSQILDGKPGVIR